MMFVSTSFKNFTQPAVSVSKCCDNNPWPKVSPQLSNEKDPGWLGYMRDYSTQLLYIGIIRNHEIRIPINQPVWKVRPGFFRGSIPVVLTASDA